MTDFLDNLLAIAIESALKAGEEIMEIYESSNFEIVIKEDASPVTKADKASNDIIIDFLEKTGIPILSEESKITPYKDRANWESLWIVDPLDGTKEFIKKNGDFTVNIALIENQIPVLGVIYIPVTKELYFATKTKGSFKLKNVKTDEVVTDILEKAEKLPLKNQKKSFTFVASQTHNSKETIAYLDKATQNLKTFEIISRGSSLKLCMIAEGSANVYPRLGPTMEWDIAAGHAICLYAGFDVTSIDSNETLKYNKINLLNNWFKAQ